MRLAISHHHQMEATMCATQQQRRWSLIPLPANQYLPTSVVAEGHTPSLRELHFLPPLGNRGMSVYNELEPSSPINSVKWNFHNCNNDDTNVLKRVEEEKEQIASDSSDEKTMTNADATPFIVASEQSTDSSQPAKISSASESLQKSPTKSNSSPPLRQPRHRLLSQNTGRYNMLVINIPHYQMRLLSDMWTTLVDLPWRYVLILFLLSYFAVWSAFALAYWFIAYYHNDLGQPISRIVTNNASQLIFTPHSACMANVHSFTTAFLFSFESQHTIGYGFRHITDQCYEAILLLCIQSVLGVAIQAFMIGLIFTRIQRPTRRSQTLVFSKCACVCTRDGQLCVLFRVGNTRRSLLIHSRVTAHLVHHRKTLEGELLPLHQHELYVQLDSMSSSASAHHHLAWPMTACHIINSESPLYDMDRTAMTHGRFELIVTLEGVIESTGQIIQACTSYLPVEILWGYRFAPLLTYRSVGSALGRKFSTATGSSAEQQFNKNNISTGYSWSGCGKYAVDFEQFDRLERVEAGSMPECSAAELEKTCGGSKNKVSQGACCCKMNS